MVRIDDQEKLNHYKEWFLTILNGCQTNIIFAKKGGELYDGCTVYIITAAKSDEMPFKDYYDWIGHKGEFTCIETDTSEIRGDASPLKGTYTCWYTRYPDLTDVFNILASKNYNNIN